MQERIAQLKTKLQTLLGDASVVSDATALELLSSDVYSKGTTAALAIAPRQRDLIPSAIRLITDAGFSVFPRGGGMSYTSGYLPNQPDSVVVDMSQLNSIVEVNADDMTITVEAGVTWQQIYEELEPRKLRLPFFGTFSGSKATVGGGMSNGALFMGTARYGTGAEIVLGMEVVTATGKLIKTGQAGFNNGKPFYRTYGPDMTGLFVHDAGALGIKILLTLRMMPRPHVEDYASFVFSNIEDTVAAMSDIARSGRTEEVYVLDPEATRRSLDSSDLKKDIKRLLNVLKSQGNLLRGLRAGATLVGAGRKFVADNVFTLHIVCAANTVDAVNDDLAACGALIEKYNGGEIANSMPKAARANPFEPLNGILGSHGDRWAALNAKVAHSDALALINATDKILERHASAMQANNVSCTKLCIGISNHAFSFEPVLRWYDEWLPLHRTTPEPSHLASLQEPAPNPPARELVNEIRQEIVDLFADFGAASNQIGKTYPYFSSLKPETAELVAALKKTLDPDGKMNPGALELPTG